MRFTKPMHELGEEPTKYRISACVVHIVTIKEPANVKGIRLLSAKRTP